MAWVTRDSTEQYHQTPEPEREYTKKEKAQNWWHYHKWYVIIGAIAAVVLAAAVHDVVSKVKPDYRIGYVGSSDLPVDTVAALEQALAQFCDDRNGDGQVVVEIDQYNIDFNEETSTTDAYSQMAGVTRLSADLSGTDGPCIYLLQDAEYAENFVQKTGALQYLDGTMPSEDPESDDWTQMVYRWTDCPVLTGLELGTYTGLTLLDDEQGENQDVMAQLYLGYRAYYNEETQQASAAFAVLWQTLTAGAETTAGAS